MARKSYPQLLTPAQAVEMLTARKTRPQPWRITSVLDRLADQSSRSQVENRVAAYWAPLPARARACRGPVIETWGKGDQLALFREVQ